VDTLVTVNVVALALLALATVVQVVALSDTSML
jgi:hypothetical protein